MAAIADAELGVASPGPVPAARSRRRASFPAWRWVILILAGLYFLVPLYAALKFAGFRPSPRS